MNKSDKELQELAERGILEITDSDSNAYRHIFNVLHKAPSINLTSGFADRVINRIKALQERRSVRKDFIWLGVGLFCFFVATIVSVVITGFKLDAGAFKFLNTYGGLLVFGVLVVGFLQLAERKFLGSQSKNQEVQF